MAGQPGWCAHAEEIAPVGHRRRYIGVDVAVLGAMNGGARRVHTGAYALCQTVWCGTTDEIGLGGHHVNGRVLFRVVVTRPAFVEWFVCRRRVQV